jgi:aerobic-type carbon monoxide dehydrogenase small subunit (CoxS/CutS family)
MSEEIVLVVNGKSHVRAAEDTPLLYVLRNELRLTGPQFGCGEETCGACMVLTWDQAKPSSKLPVSRVGHSEQSILVVSQMFMLGKLFNAWAASPA